jgi:hypothetical protein
MNITGPAQRVRIYVGEADRWQGRPLADAIVQRARAAGLAGATARRAVAGFGARSRIHNADILQLSEDLPVVIDLLDGAERLAAFLPALDEMVGEGLVVTQAVDVLKYEAPAPPPAADPPA